MKLAELTLIQKSMACDWPMSNVEKVKERHSCLHSGGFLSSSSRATFIQCMFCVTASQSPVSGLCNFSAQGQEMLVDPV